MKSKKVINKKFIMYKGFVGFFALLMATQGVAQIKVGATAIVKEVTVFTSAAEVNNRVPVNLPKGSSRLYIQNVAQDVVLNSVQISGPDGITVLSVSQAVQDESEITSPAHRRVKDSLDMALARREVLVNKQSATQGALKILNKDELLGTGGKVDLIDLTKLVDYYQVKAFDLNSSLAALKKGIDMEDKTIQRLQEEIRTYLGVGGQIVVQMSNTKPIQGDLYVSYITYSANWQAYYDLKAKSIAAPLEILYKAKVTQYTGVDWKNVKLVLSTGNPTQSGNAPLLSASYANYIDPSAAIAYSQARRQNSYGKATADVKFELEDATLDKKGGRENVNAPATTMSENQLSATFDIDIPYDIASNGEPHSVTLKEFTHPASFKYYAVPKMDKDVFLLADLSDFERLNLVPGEANIIFENMFVGTSFLNTNVTTDTLSLSMGRDKSISIKRDRIMDAKSSQTSGGSKRQTYKYELRVRNAKSTTIDLLLKDQFPIFTDKSIEIELIDSGGAIVNKELGVLMWPTQVKAGETKTYRFTFTVKHPKDKTISFN